MPRFTIEQRDALVEAIALGALQVSYGGKTTTFRSLQEMLNLLSLMERDLGITKDSNRRYADYNSGLNELCDEAN